MNVFPQGETLYQPCEGNPILRLGLGFDEWTED